MNEERRPGKGSELRNKGSWKVYNEGEKKRKDHVEGRKEGERFREMKKERKKIILKEERKGKGLERWRKEGIN